LEWSVFNHGTGKNARFTGSPTVKAKRGDSFRITLIAIETEGIYSIGIDAEQMSWECMNPSGETPKREVRFVSLAPLSQDLSPPHTKQTTASLIYELDFSMECSDPAWKFISGSAELTGYASSSVLTPAAEALKFVISP
jgi:hypothetical protein